MPAFLILGILAPVFAAATAVIFAFGIARRGAMLGGFAAVGTTTAMLAWINVGKEVTGDWLWYTQHYAQQAHLSFDQYLGRQIGLVSSEPSEPAYYAVAGFISKMTDADISVLAVCVTVLVYVPIGVAILLFASTLTQCRISVAVSVIVGMLMGITFTLSTQLVRQEIAAACIGLGLVLLCDHRWRLGTLLLATAVLTHNSALVAAAGVILAVLIEQFSQNRWWPRALSFAVFTGLGLLYLQLVGDSSYAGQNDGAISPSVVVMDLCILGTFIISSQNTRRSSRHARIILAASPALYGFVLGVASQPLPLLRMYFYLEVLRALMIAFICIRLLQSRYRVALAVAAVVIATSYVELRIYTSAFEYQAGLLGRLFESPLISALLEVGRSPAS